uniref:Serpin domain-containing protein n=1 Tax=Panagrolaimus davidi TaxID=227884 RepID=A0A914QUB4_9BILA
MLVTHEKGSEAAAATAIRMKDRCAIPRVLPLAIQFIANHSFILFLTYFQLNERGTVAAAASMSKMRVNEEGTVAAAATHVGMQLKMLKITKTFSANHPFLFVIADKTHHIYFIGRHLE